MVLAARISAVRTDEERKRILTLLSNLYGAFPRLCAAEEGKLLRGDTENDGMVAPTVKTILKSVLDLQLPKGDAISKAGRNKIVDGLSNMGSVVQRLQLANRLHHSEPSGWAELAQALGRMSLDPREVTTSVEALADLVRSGKTCVNTCLVYFTQYIPSSVKKYLAHSIL